MKIKSLQITRMLYVALFVLLLGVGMTKGYAQPTGAVNGLFSVSEGQYVCFSRGNLRYQASTNTWRFADQQWDYVGSDNSNISSTYNGWIDLFGWGTSGFNHGAVCYQPWSTSTTEADYYAYGGETYNLYDGNGQADWGYNAISNGGNQYGVWRTLTSDEWNYVLNGRATSSGYRYVKATVNGVKGLILLPDAWNTDVYTLGRANAYWVQFDANIVSASDWANILETHGAVFLPVANYRSGTTYWTHSYGYYRTANSGSTLWFYDRSSYSAMDSGVTITGTGRRAFGYSVRLVRSPNQVYTISTGVTPSTGGKVTGAGNYMAGTLCTLHATPNGHYTFVRWTRNGSTVSTNPTYSFTVSSSGNYVAEFAAPVGGNGQLNGTFSVSQNDQVRFSKGNLQYQASTHTWRFAMNQYECMGVENQNVSSSYSGWIDLFGWGTSGYNHGANCYQPWSTSDNDSDYYAYGQATYNLFDLLGNADWGYNAISNGGNGVNIGWRTLTTQEWSYLFNSRTTSSGIRYAKATVNGVSGVILLPDDWNASLYELDDINNSYADYINNDITDNAWTNTFEPAGAVFLPADGRMSSGSIVEENYSDNDYGYYWSSSKYDNTLAKGVKFFGVRANSGGFFLNDGELYTSITILRHTAASVRLVCPSQGTTTSYSINVSSNPSSGGSVNGGGIYQLGTNCTVTATSNSGYSFSNWTENGNVVSTNASYSFTVTGNRNLIANFTVNPIYYTISVSANPSNGGTVNGGGSYQEGSNCTLTATPATGYSFVKWTKNGSQVSTSPNYSFTVTENASYVAVFSLNSYSISVSASPSNGGTVNGGGTYNYGSNCTLTASPNTGYTFVRWTRNGSQVSTSPSYSFTVTGNATYVAVFSLNSYTISVTATPSYGGTVNGGGTYNYGSNCTLIATPATNYSFVRWTRNGSQVSTNATYSFTVTQSASYVAEFEQSVFTHTQPMSSGWNWWSSYVELNGNEGLTQLENSLGSAGQMIKSRQDGYVESYQYNGTMGWFGSLTSICNEQMYKIYMNASGSAVVTNTLAGMSNHPITINSGWNWIGFPLNQSVGVREALSGFNPAENDVLKGRNGYTSYYSYNGSADWFGTLNTLEPGCGYMYQSQSGGTKTLVFQEGRGEATTANVMPDDNVFRPSSQRFADNMLVTSVVEMEGEELRSESHELAAFVGGECRGSVRLMYVEPMDRYVAFLTVFGEEGDELEFRLTDGTETQVSADGLVFATDGVVGTISTPKVLRFGALGVSEASAMVRIYPNPVHEHGDLRLVLPLRSGMVRVEICSTLGVTVYRGDALVSESTARLVLPSSVVSGTYVLKAVTRDGIVYYGKLVVEK